MSQCVFWFDFHYNFQTLDLGLGCFQETSAIHSWPFPKPRFREQGLALDIPISWIDLPKGDLKFPILRMTDTVSYMCKHDCLNKLMGDMPNEKMEQTLLTFWRRFSLQHADHEVFSASEAGKLSLSRTVPVMIRGDEGRGFKRTGIMMLSVQGCIGRGSRPFLQKNPEQAVRDNLMGLNMSGGSFNSRLLFGSMAKKHYSTNPEPSYWHEHILHFICFFLLAQSLGQEFLFKKGRHPKLRRTTKHCSGL